MGIYIFNTSVLVDLLENSVRRLRRADHPGALLNTHTVFGYDFDGFWEDIGTIRSFYETNLQLTRPDAPFNFYDPVRPIYTRPASCPAR
jgi:glucose-1-phosphate adenylyltransferase